jgi:hypothetical protein
MSPENLGMSYLGYFWNNLGDSLAFCLFPFSQDFALSISTTYPRTAVLGRSRKEKRKKEMFAATFW